ncbi:MAG: PAS domain S-box protein [Arthrospira platensis PCC 7345]|uniref:PAS domain S-box protein n=1 Tax=Limnospira platensis TaxID=118562 RepID=UPI0028E127E6|nr:PAS domain S-box protein [Arthrospira platensis PCC 7345]
MYNQNPWGDVTKDEEILTIIEDEEEGSVLSPIIDDVDLRKPWKIMLVDDDQEVHQATRMVLKTLTFEQRPLTFISAYSAGEAQGAIAANPDTAVLLLDVVMETNNAGLDLVKYIRKNLNNSWVRIILKTGYPGEAPEDSVIIDYDINDYKTKVEMTQQKLITTIIAALRSYRDIMALEESRKALNKLNQNLQYLVQERTKTLTEKNQILQQEIDKSRRLEQALMESNQKFRGILDIAEEAIISVGEDQRITLFNQGAERIFGYTIDEVIGQPLNILLPKNIHKIHEKHIQNFGQKAILNAPMKGRREVVGQRKNGEVFPAEASISRLQLSDQVVYTAMLQDISDRQKAEHELQRLNQELETRVKQRTQQLQNQIEQQKQTEQALRESEEKFRQFAEAISEAFFIVSRHGEVLYISPAYEQIWGRTCESLYQSPESWFDSIDVNYRSKVISGMKHQFMRKKELELEYPIFRPDGERRWIRACSFPIYDQNGNIYRFAGIAEDITVRKEAEEELQAREVALRELYQIAVAPHLNFNQRLESLLSMGRLQFGLEIGMLSHIQGDRYQVVAVQTPPGLTPPIEKGDLFPLKNTFCEATFNCSEIVCIASAAQSEFKKHPAYHNLGLQAYIGVRIVVGQYVYGTINFCSPHPRHTPFRNSERQLLQLIAMWIGNEIERQQAKKVLEQAFQNTLLQQQITDEIRQSLDSQHIVQATVSLVGEAFHVNRCLIHRYSPNSSQKITMVVEYLRGQYEYFMGIEIPISKNRHLAILLNQDQAIASDDVYKDPLLFPHYDLCRQINLKSMLSVRTSYKGEPNGVISLQQCDRFRQWTHDEIELIEAIAQQVGIALAQAQLLEQEKLHKLELEHKNQALKEATRHAEAANRAKSEFLANMSHEIRTPMNAILGFCDLLQGLVAEPRQKQYVKSIGASGKTLLALINDILDLSKIEAGKMELHQEPMDLRVMLEEIYQIFCQKAAEKKVELIIEINDDLPKAIIFDEVRLRQILLNVVGNALKFTDNGSVKVSVLTNSNTPVNADNTEPTMSLEIAIADTGIGIAPEQQERIFDSFIQSEGQSTRKYGGSGLGLAITKRLTQMLGGTISLESQLGKGSKFTLIFPQVTPIDWQPDDRIVEINDDLNQIQSSKILVVDDVQSNLDLIQGYFVNSHHHLWLAHNGIEAIQIAELEKPDLIMMDLRMPELDGVEATKQLKANPATKQIPIIILTASSLDRDHQELSSLQDGFLHKPVSRSQLVLVLKQLLPLDTVNTVESVADDTSPVPPAFPVSPEFPHGSIDELLEKLQQQEEIFWPELGQTLKMRDLQAFSEQLVQWSQQYPYPAFVEYALTLSSQLEQFDWDKIPGTVRAFPDLRRSLIDIYGE